MLVNAQILLIDKTDTDYLFNENILRSKDKVCYVFNYLSKDYIEHGGFSLKPLIMFKVFDYAGEENVALKPMNSINLKDYLKNTILPKLSLDMSITKNNFQLTNSDLNIRTFDSLVIYDGEKYRLIKGGVSLIEFFNVYPYKQTDPLQTNQSVFNIKSMIVSIHSWVLDSLPIPRVEEILGGRMFLLRKSKNDYTFFRHAFDCSDCPLTFYNEYVYRKDYGIIAFKSKYLQFYNGDASLRDPYEGRILESDKYYYFR